MPSSDNRVEEEDDLELKEAAAAVLLAFPGRKKENNRGQRSRTKKRRVIVGETKELSLHVADLKFLGAKNQPKHSGHSRNFVYNRMMRKAPPSPHCCTSILATV